MSGRAKLVALALVPFLFVPFMAEERELPRHTLVQFAAFGALAIALAQGRLHVPRRLGWAAGAVLASLTLSALSADAPLRSVFGPYAGHTGALAWAAYLALLLGAPPARALRSFAAVFAAVGAVQASIGIAQRVGGVAPEGTIGHVAFFGAFCALGAVMTLGLGHDLRDARARVLAHAAFVVQVAAVALSTRRGPLLALGVAIALFVLLSRARRRLVPVLAAGLAALVLAHAAGPPKVGDEKTLATRWLALLDAGAVPPEHDTVGQRLDYYRVAASAALERPVLGWGFGTFRDHYAAHRTPSIGRYEARVHNVGLELWLALGFVGVAAFLFLAFEVGRAAYGQLTSPAADPDRGCKLACAMVGVAYALELLVSFDQPVLGGWAFAALAFVAPPGERRVPRAWAWAPAALILVVIVRFSADALVGVGIDRERAGDAGATSLIALGARLAPHECLYTLRLTASLRARDPAGSAARRQALLEPCARRGLDPFVHHHLGLAYLDGVTGLLGQSRAIVSLARARDLSPGYPRFHQALAQALADGGDAGAALASIDAAIALDDQQASLHNDRGNILTLLGRRAEAARAYRRAIDLAPGNPAFTRNYELLLSE